VVGGIFTVVGLAMLGGGLWTGNRQYTILKSWPTLEAEVTKSQVTHHVSYSSRSHTDTTMYQAEIEFRYTVDGRQFTTPSTPGYSTSSYGEMKRMADTYAPGTRHTIRYNPANPNDIRFNAGYNFGFFFLPLLLGGMGVVFAGLGIGNVVASRSGQPLQCPACGQAVERGQKFCSNCAAPLQIS
jgi:hypothetical protein